MSIASDDPRLTAYALGEMDPAEREAFEAELADNPEARRQVEQIRTLAAELSGQLAAEPAPELTAPQKQALAEAAGRPAEGTYRPARRSLIRLWVPMAAAAGIVIAFWVILAGLGQQKASSPSGTDKLAVRDSEGADAKESLKDKTGGKPLQYYPAIHSLEAPRARELPSPSLPPPARPGGTLDEAANAIPGMGPVRLPAAPEAAAGGPLGTYAEGTVHADIPARREYRQAPGVKSAEADDGVVLALRKADLDKALAESKRRLGPEHRQIKEMEAARDRLSAELAGIRRADGEFHTEAYDAIVENAFLDVRDHPLSTFSIDVDTASYANVRRMLKAGQLPPAGAVRIEELINYFTYDYEPPRDGRAFAVHLDVTGCPWAPKHRLVRVALKGRIVEADKRPATNLVFLLDVSGSMRPANKLPLVQQAMKMLVERLGENDTVAIAVYAGASGLVLDATSCDQKETVIAALDRLAAGGSTNGGDGIRLAYKVAAEHFIKGGVNRVILCTDGDFNVGTTSRSDLVQLVQEKATTGVFLSVLGFGMGNYKDATLETLADKGNGNYAYIDTAAEAQKVLVEQMTGTLVTIAKDVKIQIEFNPARVAEYRLIGYENRILAKEDFNDDTKDAGEIGAGHTVTALYEIVPAAEAPEAERPARVDPLKYQTRTALTETADTGELLTVKLRHKAPDADKSELIERAVLDRGKAFNEAPNDLKFAAAVASFGMILRDSKYVGTYNLDAVAELAEASRGADPAGRRAEFVELVKTAARLKTGS
ncbi:MAG TPA: von Willebrand factor type A domain-containing protein [Phycisphaerae bacterium]|nr:von Willebrand factor type A domain-containing protein [Phycisphaerae bacterium]